MKFFLRALHACTSFCFWATLPLAAQTVSPSPTSATVTIGGSVLDPSGAAIPKATVHLHTDAADVDAMTDSAGHFTLNVPAATYTLSIEAAGFRDYVRAGFAVNAQRNVPLNVKLEIATAVQEVSVPSDPGVSTEADANKSALVFKGDQLDTFSDDPATMNQQLLALAGTDPSNPPQLYVDGFSNGTLPPKESIREIRINQNPFSAQYDSLGYGRIEVLTKPGTGKLHGGFSVNVGNSALNARNPYTTGPQPGYSNDYFNGNVNGPLGKKSSFFLSGSRGDQASNAIINAVVGQDASGNNIGLSEAVPNPSVSQTYSLRLDRQFGAADTFIGRYTYNGIKQSNGGTGLLVLPDAAYNSFTRNQTLQLSDTHLFGAKVVLDSNFQYIRTRVKQDAVSAAPSLVVQGAFTSGGSYSQSLHDNQDKLEFQEYLSISQGKHFIRTGMRYRTQREANLANSNYNGQFVFPNITAYRLTQQGIAAGQSDAAIRATCVTDSSGTKTCGGATQYSIARGNPAASLLNGDLGVYAEDEWKTTPNLTLTYGLRLESESAIPDHFDFAPRVGVAWSVTHGKKAPKPIVVLRGGFGLFYTRFASGNILQTLRQNGVNQLNYIVTNPDYANPTANLTVVPPTIYTINPHLQSPVAMFGILGLERSLGKYGNFGITGFLRRSVHQFESLNINAPLPGTYVLGVANSGVRPMGGTQNIYQYSSDGVANGRVINGNLNLNVSKQLSIFAFGSMQHQAADTVFNSTSFVSNSYHVGDDYGPSTGFSARQLFTGINAHPGLGLSLNMFLAWRSSTNFNITTGQDNNGDTVYNDRPAFATDLTRASVVRTGYGNFDTQPIAGQTIIPINYGHAPGNIYSEVSVSKSFKFGPRPATPASAPAAVKPAPNAKPVPLPDPKYSLFFGVEADNFVNHVNPGTPVGVLSSPFFGRSISLNNGFNNSTAANRSISLRTGFFF